MVSAKLAPVAATTNATAPSSITLMTRFKVAKSSQYTQLGGSHGLHRLESGHKQKRWRQRFQSMANSTFQVRFRPARSR